MPELQQPDIVGNFLSSYGTAQAQQQAQQDREFNKQRVMRQDDMAEQQFGMQQQKHQFEIAQQVVDMLGSVQDGDEMGFERAKQRWGQMGLPMEAVAGFTVADLPSLRVKAGTQLRELQAQQVRAQTAAANRSNRPQPNGGGRGGGVTIDPETGALVVTPGMSDMKLTEGQSKDIAFLNRASAANAKLDADRTAALVSSKNLGRNVPFVGNALQSSSSRQGGQIGKDFIAAVLRKDTGAAVTEQEFDFYSDIFLPQWGDDAASIALKEQSRKSFLDGMRSGLSNGASLARMGVVPPPALATPDGTQPPPAGAAGAPATTPPPPPGARIIP